MMNSPRCGRRLSTITRRCWRRTGRRRYVSTFRVRLRRLLIRIRRRQILHDEINTLQLELGQIEERNQTLTKDNAKLLQRWLDAKQAEVNRVNEANDFYEEMRSQKQAVVSWRDGADPASAAGAAALADALEDLTIRNGPINPDARSGNGELRAGATRAETATNGTRSPRKDVSLTPNG